jgi:hypothetical protein
LTAAVPASSACQEGASTQSKDKDKVIGPP